MLGYLGGAGFITKHSSMGPDVSLLISMGAFVLLTIGVVLNAVLVVFWMFRSFRLYVPAP